MDWTLLMCCVTRSPFSAPIQTSWASPEPTLPRHFSADCSGQELPLTLTPDLCGPQDLSSTDNLCFLRPNQKGKKDNCSHLLVTVSSFCVVFFPPRKGFLDLCTAARNPGHSLLEFSWRPGPTSRVCLVDYSFEHQPSSC